MIKRRLFFFCLIFLSLTLHGQQRSFYSISTNDGLSQNSVTSIVQDAYGFMWIATQDGLNRYDGNHFKKYPVYFSDVTAEEFSQLGRVYRDKTNRIWALTLAGDVSYYDEASDELITVADVPDANVILQGGDDVFWIGSVSKGLFRLSVVDEEWTLQSLVDSVSIYNLTAFDDDLLLSTSKGVFHYHADENKVESINPELQHYHISDILTNKDASLLVATYSDGLFSIDEDGGINRVSSIPEKARIQDIHKDRLDNIWVATFDDGVYLINTTGTHHMLDKSSTDADIGYNDILCVYEDDRGDIWLGTDGGGISLNRKTKKIISSVVSADMPAGISVDVSRAIATDRKGDLWIGTSGKGLTRINRNKGTAVNYNSEKKGKYSLPYDRIVSLYNDSSDRLWVGTQEGGLFQLEQASKEIRQVEIDVNTIWQIKEKSNNHLWLCTRNNGIVDYDIFSGTSKSFKIGHEDDSQEAQSIRAIIPANVPKHWYVGTDNGEVFSFNESDGSFELIDIGLTTGGIKCLYLDGSKLWIGSQGQGIIIYDILDKSRHIITSAEDLPNDVIYAILEQDDRYVWVSTNQGLCQIDKYVTETGRGAPVNQILNYKNGLVCNEFNTGSYHQDDKGTLFFGGIEGVVWFNPEEVQKDNSPVDLLFLSLNSSNKDGYTTYSLYNRDRVELNYNQRHFQVSYTDLSYTELDNLEFQYRLVGHNQTWVDNLNSRIINFTNVQPGNYQLEIRAYNEDGILNKTPHSIEIVVVPAYWQTWWFRTLLLLGGLLLAYFLLNLRISAIKKTAQLKQNMALAEAKALKAQMNPHFLFNSLNAIDNYILSNDAETASNYLAKFSKLIRQILDYSDQPKITLAQEVGILELYVQMEQMRFPERFDLDINISPELKSDELHIPPMILQPFVENAIWHGFMHLDRRGLLELDFAVQGEFLVATIKDDGIGRSKAQSIKSKSAISRKSYGVKVTKERLELLNDLEGKGGDLIIEDNPGGGTIVMVRFPLDATIEVIP